MPPAGHDPSHAPLDLSVVAPAHNEEDNVGPLAQQVSAALEQVPGLRWELVVVDDGSTDSTRRRLLELAADRPWLRVVAMTRTPAGAGNGQSAAFWAGIRASRAPLIATIDADLQNDPADLPRMLEEMRRTAAGCVQGDRSHARKDGAVRRWGSVVGRVFRRMLLGDSIRDTGCSLRIMRREAALELPLEFKGAHRFIPVTIRRLGYPVVEMQVGHRPRVAGQTKYGMGITRRAIPGLIDCFAMRWMYARRRPTDHELIEPAGAERREAPPRQTARSAP